MTDNDHSLRPASRVIHGGQSPEPITGAVMPPIFLSSTYAQASPGEHKGFEYSRSHNPTRYAFERCIASVEGSKLTFDQDVSGGGFAFASGLASIGTALELLDSGDTVVAMDDLYGGTYRLMTNVRERSQGLNMRYVDLTDHDALDAALDDSVKMIWIETPTNPMMKVVDLQHIATVAKKRGILTVCDNTFATPMLQRPLELGIDIVMHSVTKYIGGHSDVVGGVLVTGRADIAEQLRYLQNAIGSVMGPFDSYMTLRGLKTLAIRMRQHCSNAMTIAQWLSEHEQVNRVFYPGLESHPQFEIASRQMMTDGKPAGGGMISVDIHGDLNDAKRFLENVHMFALAESLGGVESLIEHPAIMTHASVPVDQRAALGISDTLIRLSVGIEDVNDLMDDLKRGFAAVASASCVAR